MANREDKDYAFGKDYSLPSGGGLLSSDQDLQTYLNDLLYGTRTTGAGFSTGPYSGSFQQQRIANPAMGQEFNPPDVNASLRARLGNIGPLQASLTAALRNDQSGSSITPGAQFNYGPVTLGGSYDPKTGRPTFTGSLNVPLGQDAGATIGGSVTPEQAKAIFAQAFYNLDPQSRLEFMLQHSQPDQGTPDTRFGVAYRRRF